MANEFTLKHALSRKSFPDIKDLSKRYNPSEQINPRAGKPELIDGLIPNIPKEEQERIIDSVFNTPKSRYTAHLAVYETEVPNKEKIEQECNTYNIQFNKYDIKLEEYQTNQKEEIQLVSYDQEELWFYYTNTVRRPDFDHDSMESRPLVIAYKIRIVINLTKKLVTIFTGDKDLFNQALTAIASVLGKSFKPLNPNKTGITPTVSGSFSFHTVKILDFIYHGLSIVGTIGGINQIELDTPSKSKKPQKVKVQGDDLLDDKSICDYLVLYGRDLVGLKLDFFFEIEEEKFKTTVDFSIRDNRVKIGIKKDNYSIEKVKEFFEILENNTRTFLEKPGLINEKGTSEILERIRKTALGDKVAK